MKISFGNIPQNLTEEDLKKIFSEYGEVKSMVIKRDKKTGVSLGYGHLEMEDNAAHVAIQALNGKEIEGKAISVVDATTLKLDQTPKDKSKVQTNPKIQATQRTGSFSTISTVRKTGGGGRGK